MLALLELTEAEEEAEGIKLLMEEVEEELHSTRSQAPTPC
jgi:hypothetical protein